VQYGELGAAVRDAAAEVPIYRAASGPGTLEMAGRVADGALLQLGPMEEELRTVAAGAADAGRPAPPAFVCTSCLITDDVERASRLLKPACIRIAQLEVIEVFRLAGVHIEVPDHTMGAHGDAGHAKNLAEASRSLDEVMSTRRYCGSPAIGCSSAPRSGQLP